MSLKFFKICILIFLVSFFFADRFSVHAQTSCIQKCVLEQKGDTNCDLVIDSTDYVIWKSLYLHEAINIPANADFNKDGKINLVDLDIWRYFTLNPPAVPSSSCTTTPSIVPSIIQVTTVPSPKKGIWISQEEIMNLPMTGDTWNKMVSVAEGNIGSANLSDQDSTHPENTLALVLVAVRKNSPELKLKAANELSKAIGTENNPDPDCASPELGARGLAVGRNVIAYAVAGDILQFRSGGYDPDGKGTAFQNWISSIRNRKNCDSNGKAALSDNICSGINNTTSNGNLLSAASCVAAAEYLGEKPVIESTWLQFRRYAGDTSVGKPLDWNSYSGNWKAGGTTQPYVGINPKGAHCSGNSSSYPADGVAPSDQGRGGDCPTDVKTAPGYTAYPWEGLQGAYALAVMFERLGYTDDMGRSPWQLSDNALLRAVQYQLYLQNTYGGEWFDAKRAAWVKHLACVKYKNPELCNTQNKTVYNQFGGGRNMDWTQWTHQ